MGGDCIELTAARMLIAFASVSLICFIKEPFGGMMD
jgi:hypothetical protein